MPKAEHGASSPSRCRARGQASAEIAAGSRRPAPSRIGLLRPKDVTILESYNLGLQLTVDFGWYGILARPLLWLLKKTQGYVGNWGIAILVVTFLIRLLLFR